MHLQIRNRDDKSCRFRIYTFHKVFIPSLLKVILIPICLIIWVKWWSTWMQCTQPTMTGSESRLQCETVESDHSAVQCDAGQTDKAGRGEFQLIGSFSPVSSTLMARGDLIQYNLKAWLHCGKEGKYSIMIFKRKITVLLMNFPTFSNKATEKNESDFTFLLPKQNNQCLDKSQI